jgi:hypothetical protein
MVHLGVWIGFGIRPAAEYTSAKKVWNYRQGS